MIKRFGATKLTVYTRGMKKEDSPSRIAVLLMAYGSPTTLDDVEAYYTDIRRGRPPTPNYSKH